MKIPRVRPALLLAALALLSILTLSLTRRASAQSAPARYTNLVNTRFATISSGPQSSLIVDVPADATDKQVRDAVMRTARAEWKAKATVLAAQADRLERAGLLKRGQTLPLASLALVRKSGRMVVPPRRVTRGVGGGTLTFRYTGFNDTDTQLLQGFIATAYPRIVAVYGQPAVSGEVEIVNAGGLDNTQIPEVRRFAFGIYDASNNRIMLPIFNNPVGTLSAMLLCMIHAFHGPAVFQYDTWEEGFARATAAIVLRDPIFNAQYGMDDPSANSLYSLLRYYDLLNQPPLGNSTFFPPSQANISVSGLTVAKMLWARIGMSGAAWLKVYVENQNFFSQFNAAYYAQFDPTANPSLAGNVPALKSIAAPLLPSGVEGIPWADWYSQQYVLDTSIGPGTKLYAFVIPGLKSSDGSQAHSITLVYYQTEKTGDETLLNGRAYATYFDDSNATISLGAGSEQTVITDGEGPLTAVTTNSAGTDATRVTMDFSAGNQTTRVYVPAGFDGDFQGVLLSENGAKTISVSHTNVPTFPPVQTLSKSGNIEGGSFGLALGTGPNDLGVTTVQVSDGTNTRSYRMNTGDGSSYVVLRDGARGGGVVTVSKTFDSSLMPYLVSFPLRPLSTDVAAALGLAPGDFLLSYWDSLRTTYETFNPGQPSVAPLELGRGYWLKIAPQDNGAQRTVTITGVAPATETDLSISCPFGWNLVGSPFDQPTDLTNVQVKYLQNDPMPWSDAVDQNLVASEPFALDRTTGQYTQVNAFSGGDWQGYWVRVFTPSGVTILLPGPDAPTRAARAATRALVPTRKVSRAAAATVKPAWSVRLRVHQEVSGRVTTAEATLGAVQGTTRAFDNRYDVELPPAILPTVAIAFPHTAWGKSAGGRYVTDFREPSDAQRGTWDMTVSTPADGPVTVTWDRLGTLSRRAQLALVDAVTGDRISLTSRSSYTFAGEAGKTRALQIVADAAPSLPLDITNVVALPTRGVGTGGTGLSLSYVVTRSAAVQFEVAALNGRVLRTISGGRAQAAGQQRLFWDGRSQSGAALPPGPYLVTLSARDDDGHTVQVRRMATLLQ